MTVYRKISFLCIAFSVFAFAANAQTKKNAKPTPTPEAKIEEPAKRNGRPDAQVKTDNASKASATHFYEFVRPGFSYGRIVIEHDDAGRGTISFLKDGHDETLTDPVELSKTTIEKIKETLAAMMFVDSTDDYQHARDYAHMGNMTFTLKREGRSRTVKYNWTENPLAKALMDEYRRISNEYTWRFEMFLARENMPLQTPGLMDALDGYFKRNEISDPPHMIPVLTQLSNDERLPLMARNRATKLIKEIEKVRK